MTFEEWWKGSGQTRGEDIFRNCWDVAIESAAKSCENSLGFLGFNDEDPGSIAAAEIRELKVCQP